MKRIESAKNPQVKQWKKLLTKKEREATGLFMIEGYHLVEEALKAGVTIVDCLVDESVDLPPTLKLDNVRVTYVVRDVILAVSSTETPQGIVAICRQLAAKELDYTANMLLLDAVQDPGNVGTMIRTADAAGVKTVVFGEGTVDLYNPKTLRSTQGSLFYMNVVKAPLLDVISAVKARGVTVFGTSLRQAKPIDDVEKKAPFALIVGNEGSGVAPEHLALTDENVYIPIYGHAESLNVGVATGIALYMLRK